MSLQVHLVKSNSSISAGSTSYVSAVNGQVWTTTEHRGTCIAAAAGTLSNWKVVLSTAPGVGRQYVFTFRINGADSAATITISGTNTFGTYVGSPISIADGDEITFKSVPSGTPAVAVTTISWDFNSTTSNQSIYGGGNVNGPVATNRTNRVLCVCDATNWDAGNAQDIIACPGTITKLWIKLDTDVTASGSVMFTINKNGTAQDGTGGTPDTRINFTTGTTKSSSTFSLTVAAGDRLSLSAVRTGSPATIRPIIGSRLVSTVAGQSNFSMAVGSATLGVTEYTYTSRYASSGNATESNVAAAVGITGFVLQSMQARINIAANGAWIFNLRKNAGAGSNTVTIPDTAINGSDSLYTSYTAGDTIDLQMDGTSSVVNRGIGVALIQSQTIPGGGEKTQVLIT